jgi:hypothetical protein
MFSPKIVFLSEIRQNKRVVEAICRRLGFEHCFPVCVKGKGGGLVLMWSKSVSVELINFSVHHIDVKISEPNRIKWRATFVYGEPRVQDRHLMWEMLRRIKPSTSEPWFMVGDFNEVLWQKEHLSAKRRSEHQMQLFRDVLSHCDMVDLGYKCLPWTYNNKQKGENNVRVRLDRAVAQPRWSNLFPGASVEHVVSSRSDHCPLVVRLGKKENVKSNRLNKRYEIMWEREESLMEEIQLAWTKIRSKQDLEGVKDKLNETMATLQVWSNEKFGSVEKELKELRRKLEKLQQAYNPDDLNEIDEVQKRMDELLIREELTWLQRSTVTWLREGDKNTSFFHRKASNRSRKNKIKKLKLDDDSFAENNEEMKEVVTDFLRNCIRKT